MKNHWLKNSFSTTPTSLLLLSATKHQHIQTSIYAKDIQAAEVFILEMGKDKNAIRTHDAFSSLSAPS